MRTSSGSGAKRWARWGGVLAAMLLALPAAAEQYTVPIVVTSESDIVDLRDNGDITDDEMDILLELFHRKVDLNRATRDEMFELPGMTYPMADAILRVRQSQGRLEGIEAVAAIEEVPDEVLQQIEPFVVFGRPRPRIDISLQEPITGSVRLKTLEAFGDGSLPVASSRVRLSSLGGRLEGGWTALARERPGPLTLVQPTTGDPFFLAEPAAFRPSLLEKAHLSWRDEVGDGARVGVILGSYMAGFGERLVFDTSNRRRPYGFYPDELVYDSVGGLNYSADMRPHRGLFGAAASAEGLRLGDAVRLDLTALFSWRSFDEYMYRYTPNRTYFSAEDAEGGATGCFADERCHAYATFSNVYNHQVVGGNVRLWTDDRTYVGLTAYGAQNRFLEGDGVVSFTPSARQPLRPAFGAYGLEAATAIGLLDVQGEVARTDRGGMGALLRTQWDLDPVALELTGRHYDRRFDNPFGRAEASPGQFLGLRARDESGVKARVIARPIRELRLVGHADTWVHPSLERQDLDLFLRTELDPVRQWRWAVWTRLVDKDVGVGGRDQTYDGSPSVNYSSIYEAADPDLAAEELRAEAENVASGMRKELGQQLTWRPATGTHVAVYGRMTWRDVRAFDDRFERGYSAWVRGSLRPISWLTVSSRLRYVRQDMDAFPEDTTGDGFLDTLRGDSFAEAYLRAAISFPRSVRGSVRYDIRTFTDFRERERDPQHLVRATFEVPF